MSSQIDGLHTNAGKSSWEGPEMAHDENVFDSVDEVNFASRAL